jgi:phenylacetate-CoA ligase
MIAPAPVADRQVEISIIIPCLNEAENILELTERARATFETHHLSGEVVFVNDGSTDHTGQLIDQLAGEGDFVRGVHHTRNLGIPAGWQSGLQAARGRYIVIMDGDLQYLPEDVYRLYRQLKYTNADLVQGYRSHIGRARDFRYLMSRVLHHMLRLLFGVRLFDIKSGFLICDREVFAHILRRRFSYYYFQTFIVISAHHKGYRVEEIESLFEERKLGESFIAAFPFKMILKNLVDVAKGFVEFRLLPARSDVLADFLSRHPPERPPQPLPLWRRLALRAFTLLMPLHHWKLSSGALRYHDQLRRTQWLAPEHIRGLQETRLRALVKHAYRHVSYYRDRFDRLRIDPDEIQRLEDLQRLPLLTKDALRRNLHFDLLSDVHDKLRMLPITTSGVSGEPLTVYADRTQLEMRWAAAMRNQEWTGYRFGDRQVRLLSSNSGNSRLQRWRAWLEALLSRRTVAPATDLSRAAVGRDIEVIRRRRPAVIEGDAETLHLLARYLQHQRVDGLRPAAVTSSEQTLSAESRAVIEEAFQTAVFDRYTSRELGEIAHECEHHRGYHVNAECFIVEIMCGDRPARPGETGDVLVTDLTNLSVPLIRYAIGDRATAVEPRCPCGRGLPLIGAIQGRDQAIIAGTDGRAVPGMFFADLLKEYGHVVRQFKVVQERAGVIDFFVVKGPRFSAKLLDNVLALFRAHLGDDLRVAVHVVDRIEAGAAAGSSSVSGPPITADLLGA